MQRKRKRRAKAKVVHKVEPLAKVVIRTASQRGRGPGMPERLKAASERSARLMEEQEKEEAAAFKEAQAQRAPEDRRPEPRKSLRVFERKHLWAWLHQATDPVLQELYETVMDAHGQSELGHLLREYRLMRHYYPDNPLAAERCPFCQVKGSASAEGCSRSSTRKTTKG